MFPRCLRCFLLVVAVLATTGCSLALRGPGRPMYNSDGRPAEPDCTDSSGVPVMDIVAGTGLILLGGALMGCEPKNDSDVFTGLGEASVCMTSVTVGIPMVLGGLVQGGIGLAGFGTTSACTEAKAKHRQRLAAMARQREQFMPPPAPPQQPWQ